MSNPIFFINIHGDERNDAISFFAMTILKVNTLSGYSIPHISGVLGALDLWGSRLTHVCGEMALI